MRMENQKGVTRAAIVGFGLIGRERLKALQSLAPSVVVVGVSDPALTSETLGGDVPLLPDLDALIRIEPDVVIVATPHDIAVPIVSTLLATGTRVLIEKPLGRTGAEAEALVLAQAHPGQLHVGFNYRFLAGVSALLSDAAAGWFGNLISATMTLGHGGSPGDEETWKLDPQRAGGGCLLDPGVHAIDLLTVLLGTDLDVCGASTWKGFWNTGIEEEGHVLLRAPGGALGRAELSVARWRSTFRLEVNGTEGYGVVTGRGRSYGPQEYRRGRRWGWMNTGRQADSEELVVLDPGEESFVRETEALLGFDVRSPCSAEHALLVMRLLDVVRDHASE